ncbi:hypothetical protein HD597_004096 [Nonomuraea thailandensis]|uniref:Chaplin n=1 Tax=Nonomuraea thailandensis TaxID=1188745 RepID=A0A9X2GKC2_9ACTN|nr:hypothetical protein [Nonomuraea thailandensis]MCP2357076.1 hypothetical protein [Nonomuraea thailandensis]
MRTQAGDLLAGAVLAASTTLVVGAAPAGPVYVSAPGQCIDVSGTVVAGKTIDLDNVHCG